MIEQLDNPVWSALIWGNEALSVGNDKAKRFQSGVSPFVAIAKHDLEHYQALKELVPSDETVAVFTTDEDLDPSPWNVINRIDGYQMVYEGETSADQNQIAIIKLSEKNVSAMLELTKLSLPGPFMKKTIRFERYEGRFDGDQLVAMAGHRFYSSPYVEIVLSRIELQAL